MLPWRQQQFPRQSPSAPPVKSGLSMLILRMLTENWHFQNLYSQGSPPPRSERAGSPTRHFLPHARGSMRTQKLRGKQPGSSCGHKSASSPCSPAQAPCSVSLSGMHGLPTLLFSSRLSSDVCGGRVLVQSAQCKVKGQDEPRAGNNNSSFFCPGHPSSVSLPEGLFHSCLGPHSWPSSWWGPGAGVKGPSGGSYKT